ncbi:MAG TPA: SET domain-containing protein [Patescibacteria group bacterium]|nr:SET domain-containing protein [Patescibacteria group bacterium]
MTSVFIAKGKLAGKGVYAARDFRKGEIVVQYRLIHVSQEEFEKLPESEKEFTHSYHGHIFLYQEPERYVNHSDTPNTYQDHTKKADIALRDIKKGEMITTDARKDDVI